MKNQGVWSCFFFLSSLQAINPSFSSPGQYSAFAELQVVLGSQLLSIFQRRPVPICCCAKPGRLWIEPFGTWLEEKAKGDQIGFNSQVKGISFGLDTETCSNLFCGFGGVWNRQKLDWKEAKGEGTVEGYYGAFYCDYFTENNYLGAAFLSGLDFFDVVRRIPHGLVTAKTNYRGLDFMTRLSVARFYGSSLLALYPYLNLDLLCLKQSDFTEHQAERYDLKVSSNQSSTLRTELGFTFQVQDKNVRNNFCFSPLVSSAWVMEYPIQRDNYTAILTSGMGSFQVKGWDHTWQIFLVRLGVDITYRCFSLSGDYTAEMSSGAFLGQKADVRFEVSW